MISRRLSIGLLCVALSAGSLSVPAMAAGKARILVYSGSTGFRHDSIPAAVEVLKVIGAKAGYTVDASEDPEVFSADNLKQYKALVLVSTSTDPKKPESEWFTGAKRDALQGFLKDGKGVVALHAAADSHYNWGWYGQMIGGYFERHPKGTPKGTVTVIDARNPATAKLPKTLERNDEWYYYKDFDPTVHVLVTIDPKSIGDGEADVNPNPLVWCHNFGGGRVFYSALGHTSESYSEPYMVKLLSGALVYAAGK
ncbi:MAG: ThuA domain-containing protein [Pseudomonadota bacterium]